MRDMNNNADKANLTKADDGRTSSATERALDILVEVSSSDEPIAATHIAARLALPVPTVHRLVRHLEELGYLERMLGSKRLSIGPMLQRLAFAALVNSDIRGRRNNTLRSLVDVVKETCNITVLNGDEVAYIDRVESHWPLRTHLHPGSKVPIHCGASGKVFLAHMPAYRRRRLLYSTPLQKMTDRTVTDPSVIEKELNEVRRQGYAIDNEEFLNGLIGLAVPIFDRSDRVCATVSMHAPTVRHSADTIQQHVPSLQHTSSLLRESMFWND